MHHHNLAAFRVVSRACRDFCSRHIRPIHGYSGYRDSKFTFAASNLSALLAFGAAGCKDHLEVPSTNATVVKEPIATNPDRSSILRLEHDFGVLRPNSACGHVFTIFNPSKSDWSLRQANTGCHCTIARLTEGVIRSRMSSEVLVEYTAGAKPADDTRTVTLLFNESNAPVVELVVSSHIRRLATPEPLEVFLPVAEPGGSVASSMEVLNYSGQPWANARVTLDVGWIDAAVAQQQTDSSNSETIAPLEAWHVTLHGHAQDLPSGIHHARMCFEARANDMAIDRVEVPIHLRVEPLINAVPNTLVLGGIPPTQGVRKSIHIYIRDARLLPARNVQCDVSHDLGTRFSAAVSKVGETSVTVELKGRPPFAPGWRELSGQIKVSLSHNGASGEFIIPVSALGLRY